MIPFITDSDLVFLFEFLHLRIKHIPAYIVQNRILPTKFSDDAFLFWIRLIRRSVVFDTSTETDCPGTQVVAWSNGNASELTQKCSAGQGSHVPLAELP